MLDLEAIRSQFPALARQIKGRTPIFLDGPGGTQVPGKVIEAVAHYLGHCNANHGGVFTTSRESDALLDEAHRAAADFLNAPSPDEVIFGANMTTLTFHISRSLGLTWREGDTVLVTRLDHDANVRPWVLAARDAGATVRFVDLRDDGTLNDDDLMHHLDARRDVKLLALTCASNALGTMPDVARITQQAHAAGALVYLDAVHYAPHAPIDVQAWDCDFLACSAYKFFGPHVGLLWGKRALLEDLSAYKVRPATNELPGRWMTGTQNHEGIAGTLACLQYLASLGQGATRREQLVSAMTAIREYETDLVGHFLRELERLPAWKVHGLTRQEDLSRRSPTLALTHRDRSAAEAAQRLAAEEIYAWSGNFYALELAERLEVESRGGFLRLGLVHYNTRAEVDRTLEILAQI